MKFVDSNGKLFKRFNVIDVIVVLLVLAIIAAIAWKTIADQRPVVVEEEEEEVELLFESADHLIYEVVCKDIPEEVAEAFQSQVQLSRAKRRLMSNGQPLEGYLTDCSYETEEDGLCTVYFTIEAVLDYNEGIYSVGSQEIRIGKPHIVKTYQIESTGVIYSMEVSKNG